MNRNNVRTMSFERERGAALITVLMISTLLLATGGALVLVTGLSTRTAIDATAEMQAYYSAETGLQETLNVLRGNVNPQNSMPANTTIDFRKAITLTSSNLSGDARPSCLASGLDSTCRLSGWLNYSYTSSGSSSADRVALTANYSPLTGLAYRVEISDPDNTPVTSTPLRLLVRVIGYGPKGAEKHLELVVKRTNVNYHPPAMLMMRGADNGNAAVNFSSGDSAAKSYTGHDTSSTDIVPTFGATSNGDMNIEISQATKNTVADPIAATIGLSSLPDFLQTSDQARAFLADEKAAAIGQGRYFTSYSGYSGTTTSPEFTFVDGDCNLDGGGGLLIVTGKLIMNGNPSFNGLILVLGQGDVERDGGGNGDILGAMAVARFNQNGNGPFLAPTFNTNGGGNSDMKYDSNAVRQANNVAGLRVLGVHEY